MTLRQVALQVTAAIVLLAVMPAAARAARPRALDATTELLLALDVQPFAIAHRGFGDNLGEDRSRPIENTVAAVERGFREGASVVEVDVQLTQDHRVAVFHDDFLPDFTCLNTLTLAQLRARLPYVPTLEEILAVARRVNGLHPQRGIVIIELKAAAPLCDPHDTQERAIVATVTEVIRQMRMTDQVLFTSLSPALLSLAHRHAPDIERILSVSGVQFLTQQQVAEAFDLPVTLIDKRLDLGLQWANVGEVFRLPGYRSVAELLRTAALTNARVVEADLLLLHAAGAPLVDVLHSAGLKVLGFTANSEKDWDFMQSLGVDGIYTNDVPMGVRREAAIP